MPLHLLGKKSWNVYNNENIAQVRKDEAAAKAKEEQQEQKWREEDANCRLHLLRGEEPPAIKDDNISHESVPSQARIDRRKRRRLAGEDDTDRDLRIAREDLQNATNVDLDRYNTKQLADTKGGNEKSSKDEIGPEAQGMRFKDAAGIKQGSKTPWYTDTERGQADHQSQVGQDVWGNEDPRRRDREQHRMIASDPLLAMKKGIQKLRQNEKERREWVQQRERDLNEVEDLARQQRRKRRHRRGSDENSIEGLSLDGGKGSQLVQHERDEQPRSRHHHSRRHHHHRKRSASPRRRHVDNDAGQKSD